MVGVPQLLKDHSMQHAAMHLPLKIAEGGQTVKVSGTLSSTTVRMVMTPFNG